MTRARVIAALLSVTVAMAGILTCPRGVCACGMPQARAHDCCGDGIGGETPDCCRQDGGGTASPTAGAHPERQIAKAASAWFGVVTGAFDADALPSVSPRGRGFDPSHAPPDTLLSQRTALLL